MTIIKLHGFADAEDNLSYDFEPESGEYEVVAHPDAQTAREGARGSGSERKIGLRRREQIFVALYSWEGLLHVALPPHAFTWPGRYRARRRYRRLGGPVKAFSIEEGQDRHVHFHYLFYDGGPWPGAEALDIFANIAWGTSSPAEIHRAIYYLERRARGEDVHSQEFHDRIDAYIRARISA